MSNCTISCLCPNIDLYRLYNTSDYLISSYSNSSDTASEGAVSGKITNGHTDDVNGPVQANSNSQGWVETAAKLSSSKIIKSKDS